MTRSYTEVYSNKLFVSRLETESMFHFLSKREAFTPNIRLSEVSFEEQIEPAVSADLIHEVCHAWCFDSHVGHAISLVDLRARLTAIAYPKASHDDGDILRTLVSQALMTPLAEGLALFVEFDTWRSEIQSKVRTPINLTEIFLSHSGIEPSSKDYLVDRMLEKVRNDPRFIRRKTNFYLMPFDVAAGYQPGYMSVKNLAWILLRAFPELKQETALAFFKDYFWNDPVLARMILTGPEPEQTFEDLGSAERSFELNAGLSKMDPIEIHREIFRRFHHSSIPFNGHALYARLIQRVQMLADDRSLGARLGAIQSRLEHGIESLPTWETQTTEREHHRFLAAEQELRSAGFNFFNEYEFVGPASSGSGPQDLVRSLSMLIGFLPELRRIVPLLVADICVDEDRHIQVRLRDSDEYFDVDIDRFADLEPGIYTFYLAFNAKTLDFSDFIVPDGDAPVSGPTGSQAEKFFSGTEPDGDPMAIGFFCHLFNGHLVVSNQKEDFEARVSRLPDKEKIEEEIAYLAESLYTQTSTLLVQEQMDVRQEISTTLANKGLKAFLPKKISQIERAAKISLLANAASRPEEFAVYMSINLNEGPNLDVDDLLADMQVIFEADPHQLIFRRANNAITWAI